MRLNIVSRVHMPSSYPLWWSVCSSFSAHFPPALLRYNWHITLCKCKVYNLLIWSLIYCKMITTGASANTSIMLHDYHFFFVLITFRSNFRAIFRYITYIYIYIYIILYYNKIITCNINTIYNLQSSFTLYLEVCTLWRLSSSVNLLTEEGGGVKPGGASCLIKFHCCGWGWQHNLLLDPVDPPLVGAPPASTGQGWKLSSLLSPANTALMGGESEHCLVLLAWGYNSISLLGPTDATLLGKKMCVLVSSGHHN